MINDRDIDLIIGAMKRRGYVVLPIRCSECLYYADPPSANWCAFFAKHTEPNDGAGFCAWAKTPRAFSAWAAWATKISAPCPA